MQLSQSERETLVLSCLDQLSPLIRGCAKLAYIDPDDGYQDAALLVLKILSKPVVPVPAMPYLANAIRFHFFGKYHKVSKKHWHVLSLDVDVSGEGEAFTSIADLLPAPYTIEPLEVLLEKERLMELYHYTEKGARYRNQTIHRQKNLDAWQSAMAAVA